MTRHDGAISDEQVRLAYEAYSTQDLDRLLSLVSDEVDWPDGERRLRGKVMLRAFWTEQWTWTRTKDVPVRIVWPSATACAVQIAQIVHSLSGGEPRFGHFIHILQFNGPLIARLDIVPLAPPEPSEPGR